MKIYTKTGDKGSTSLFNGQRISKANLRVDLYGTVDELISIVVIALEFDIPNEISQDLNIIMQELFLLSVDFATPLSSPKSEKVRRINNNHIVKLEDKIDSYFEFLPKINSFILPGGTKAAAFINQARTICRKAERIAVTLNETESLGEFSIRYLNRLSDYLFATMRYINMLSLKEEKIIDFDNII